MADTGVGFGHCGTQLSSPSSRIFELDYRPTNHLRATRLAIAIRHIPRFSMLENRS